ENMQRRQFVGGIASHGFQRLHNEIPPSTFSPSSHKETKRKIVPGVSVSWDAQCKTRAHPSWLVWVFSIFEIFEILAIDALFYETVHPF
ncbi:MAG: hypothetical protein J7M27_02400, partial [Candidatus Latescibacteria bacterium]|nr:hypothetical protein [Candidatus Latescibacterota bacterium]